MDFLNIALLANTVTWNSLSASCLLWFNTLWKLKIKTQITQQEQEGNSVSPCSHFTDILNSCWLLFCLDVLVFFFFFFFLLRFFFLFIAVTAYKANIFLSTYMHVTLYCGVLCPTTLEKPAAAWSLIMHECKAQMLGQ